MNRSLPAEPAELVISVAVSESQEPGTIAKGVPLHQKICQQEVQVHFFVFVVGLKGSGREGPAASFALESADFLVHAFDFEEAFLDEGSTF